MRMQEIEKFIELLSLADMVEMAKAYGMHCDTDEWLDDDYPECIDVLAVELMDEMISREAKADQHDELTRQYAALVEMYYNGSWDWNSYMVNKEGPQLMSDAVHWLEIECGIKVNTEGRGL